MGLLRFGASILVKLSSPGAWALGRLALHLRQAAATSSLVLAAPIPLLHGHMLHSLRLPLTIVRVHVARKLAFSGLRRLLLPCRGALHTLDTIDTYLTSVENIGMKLGSANACSKIAYECIDNETGLGRGLRAWLLTGYLAHVLTFKCLSGLNTDFRRVLAGIRVPALKVLRGASHIWTMIETKRATSITISVATFSIFATSARSTPTITAAFISALNTVILICPLSSPPAHVAGAVLSKLDFGITADILRHHRVELEYLGLALIVILGFTIQEILAPMAVHMKSKLPALIKLAWVSQRGMIIIRNSGFRMAPQTAARVFAPPAILDVIGRILCSTTRILADHSQPLAVSKRFAPTFIGFQGGYYCSMDSGRMPRCVDRNTAMCGVTLSAVMMVGLSFLPFTNQAMGGAISGFLVGSSLNACN